MDAMDPMDKVLSLSQCMDMIIDADDTRDSWRCIEAVGDINLFVSLSYFLLIVKRLEKRTTRVRTIPHAQLVCKNIRITPSLSSGRQLCTNCFYCEKNVV